MKGNKRVEGEMEERNSISLGWKDTKCPLLWAHVHFTWEK